MSGTSRGGPAGVPKELERLAARLAETDQEIRESVLEVESTDRQVQLAVTGDRLATRVRIAPELFEQGVAAVERSVLEAMNSATLAIERLVAEKTEEAAERAGARHVTPASPSSLTEAE